MNKKTIYWVVGIMIVLLFIVDNSEFGGFNWRMISDNRDPQMIN